MTAAPPIDNPGASLVERRHAHRHRTLLGAQIIFRNSYCVIRGQILNISDTGALLRPADIGLCPEKFSLKPRFESARDCEVVWRGGEMLGVRYV